MALSIVQARLVGLAHFTVGYILNLRRPSLMSLDLQSIRLTGLLAQRVGWALPTLSSLRNPPPALRAPLQGGDR